MTARKHLGRGLESVSHLFLSQRRPTPKEAPTPDETPIPQEAPTPVLFVTSGTDVIGKAVVACNVALELARRGHTTAVVDADASQPRLRLLMGAMLESPASPARIPIGESGELTVVETLAQATDSGKRWDYIVVNAPGALFGDAPSPGAPPTPAGATRLLLVVSADTRELIRSYALVKRTASWHSRLQLGIVVTGVDDGASARALFDQFLDVLGRQLHVLPAYCGYLPGHRAIGRSVLRRRPAVLAPEESDLAEQLRAIAAAVACEFEPGGSTRNP